jgi:enoyl-CoA hydratase/carnithine racemase
MTWDMYQALYDAREHVDHDDRVRVLILGGAGDKAFVAGTDMAATRQTAARPSGVRAERPRTSGQLS